VIMQSSEMYGTYESTRVTVDDYCLGVIDIRAGYHKYSRRIAWICTVCVKRLGVNQLADGKLSGFFGSRT
jgi:hypothetical protein